MKDITGELDKNGIYRLSSIFSPQDIRETLDLVRKWYHWMERSKIPEAPSMIDDDKVIWNLQNKDYIFVKQLFASDLVHRILMHYLNDTWYKSLPADQPNYILRSYLARSPNSALPLHIDSFIPSPGDHALVMQIGIVLEDHSGENGSLMVVPGSHKSGAYAPQEALSDAVPVTAEAGDVLIWDSRLWHGCSANRTENSRWMLIATFSRWWIKQLFRITETIPDDIYARLTDREKAVMGFCSISHPDETSGVNLKQGYDSLRPRVSDYRFDRSPNGGSLENSVTRADEDAAPPPEHLR